MIAAPSEMSLLLEPRFAGQALSFATGFVCLHNGRPFLITNRHNVTGRDNLTGTCISKNAGIPNELAIWHLAKSIVGTWICKIEPLLDRYDRPLWLEHPTLGSAADMIALPLTDLRDVRLSPYLLGGVNVGSPGSLHVDVGVADPVSVIGFPFGLTSGGKRGVWATGYIATEPHFNHDSKPIMLIDCRTRRGQSGSPVIFYNAIGNFTPKQPIVLDGTAGARYSGEQISVGSPVWELLGVYSGRVNADSDLGMVWKTTAIAEIVSQ